MKNLQSKPEKNFALLQLKHLPKILGKSIFNLGFPPRKLDLPVEKMASVTWLP